MVNGINGKILHVDLTNKKLEIEYPDDAFYRQYVGGSLLGLYYVLKNTPPGIDAFDPANTLVLSLSPLTGTPIHGQSRLTITAKSPLTELIGDSQSGGFFPAEMKFTGYDAIVIHGRSDKPVYLYVSNDTVEIKEADFLWGKTTGEVEDLLKSELGDAKGQILQCGVAGENLVRFAAVISMCNRANGRNGMGAVMGYKKLKAIVVRGNQKPKIYDLKSLRNLSKKGNKSFKESNVYHLGLYGTAGIVQSQNFYGGLPTNNWSSGTFDHWENLDGITMANTILTGRDTCYSCIVRCKRIVEVNESTNGKDNIDPKYGGPEYETLATLGSYCGIGNLRAIAYANQLCNMYGLDTISCGATIAWAMDCYENGIITSADTDGIDLVFGNAEGMITLVEKIALRDGFGDLLAEGSYRAAKKFGEMAENLVVTVKKQELPAHMPQVKRGLGLIYAVNPFGADHESSAHDPDYSNFPERMKFLGLNDPQDNDYILNKEKVQFMLITQYFCSALDSLNLCQFVFGSGWQLFGPEEVVSAVNAVTGWKLSIEDILKIGQRRLNMMKVFNLREGLNRKEDILPKKLSTPLIGGQSDGNFVTNEELEEAKDYYYELAGWDVISGNPSSDKLIELGLEWLLEALS